MLKRDLFSAANFLVMVLFTIDQFFELEKKTVYAPHARLVAFLALQP